MLAIVMDVCVFDLVKVGYGEIDLSLVIFEV